MENLRLRKNLILVYMRSSYRNGIFQINEIEHPIEKVNRANLRYNEVYDFRISNLNIVMPDKLAYGVYEVYVLKCDDDQSDVIKYQQKLASSTALDLNLRLRSIQNDLNATIAYLEHEKFNGL
ncbi:MAG: hypothetical protein GX074_01570 [Erysipelothrix sp.]|nr:hypothetical protein [Erysipelothrix sp.]